MVRIKFEYHFTLHDTTIGTASLRSYHLEHAHEAALVQLQVGSWYRFHLPRDGAVTIRGYGGQNILEECLQEHTIMSRPNRCTMLWYYYHTFGSHLHVAPHFVQHALGVPGVDHCYQLYVGGVGDGC